MPTEIKSSFEIKLEFNKNTENPSRLFYSFAEMIDSVNKLDIVIARTINSSISSKIILDDIEKGSILAKLWNELVISEDGKIDNPAPQENVKNYLENSRRAAINFVSNNKSSVEDLGKLGSEIAEIAETNKVKETFNYAEPNLIELAKSINEIKNSTDDLNGNEGFILTNSDEKPSEIMKSGGEKIDIEAVEKFLTKEELVNNYEAFYKIKKPDFLGDSQWDFKHGTKSIKVKILHQEWLDQFHKGENVVLPGDSLKVKIKQTNKYNQNGYLISEKIEIIEVLEIRKN
ncbi:hypothetical protein [Flavobacterium turcicum]|uniref:Uncharacterized protein n=1 Tax=Flavobacterium turcicum TaxID=2764718 RepID=A0ABR7JJH1_9FLAO|nr:hypothetical protein [Flavobacterium turcicum]MBC5864636.1 hypothetical protein [Flavobacterium turcicum]NHL03365.1 hypothetical protein [Flavobacterium turcicum]